MSNYYSILNDNYSSTINNKLVQSMERPFSNPAS